MSQFVGLLSPDGMLLDCNRAALEGGGRTGEEVIGRPFWETFWWRGAPQVQSALRAVIARAAKGEDVRYDIEFDADPDADIVVMDFALLPVRDDSGRVAFILAEGRDITGKKAQERAIARQLEDKVAERTAELAASNAKLLAQAEIHSRMEGRFAYFVESVTDYAIYTMDERGVVTSWNVGASRIKGYRSDEIIGRNFSCFFTQEDREAGLPERALATAAREGKYEAEGLRVRKDDSRFWANVVLDAIRDRNGTLLGFAKITRDVTERREAQIALQKAQAQLAQSQKMEGIGHLTGGVAHDFNNLLAIIMGGLETMQRALDNPEPDLVRVRRALGSASEGAKRAATLTQRLLAFSRQQPLEPRYVEVNKLVVGMSDLVRRTLGEEIVVEQLSAPDLWPVFADPNNLEIAILNLAVNARDAMPKGGYLTIETVNTHWRDLTGEDVVPGDYVVVSITDTGCGMAPEIVDRAFEPFFTTKDVGHGTGLGLSQVYGFVKQSGGHIKIYSQPGEGTTVRIYLPRLDGVADQAPAAEPHGTVARDARLETILVVEDDVGVRLNTREMLEELGYRTVEAGTANAALDALRKHPQIRLLFTDIGLPGGMNGQRLAERARELRPDLSVLFATGYARNALMRDGHLEEGVQLLTKPFTYVALAAKLHAVLGTISRSRRILLVEDEALIRLSALDQLEEIGFEAEGVGSATEALARLKALNGDLVAAIVDVGLPDRSGVVLVAEMRALRPSLPIIIASGYGDTTLRARFLADGNIVFLGKPYRAAELRAALASLHVEAK